MERTASISKLCACKSKPQEEGEEKKPHHAFSRKESTSAGDKLTLLCFAAPVYYFGEVDYHVDESDGYVEVKVWRTGTDLSKTGAVTVRSRKAEPVSAEGEVPPAQMNAGRWAFQFVQILPYLLFPSWYRLRGHQSKPGLRPGCQHADHQGRHLGRPGAAGAGGN